MMMLRIILSLLVGMCLYGETVKVVKVIDGDTIKVISNGMNYNIRLAGIDTPESYMSVKAKKDIRKCRVKSYIMIHLGLTAKEYVESVYPKGSVLTYTELTKGRYKRPVVIVDNLQDELVVRGLAVIKHYNKYDKELVKRLKPYEDTAKVEKLMIWKYLKPNCY